MVGASDRVKMGILGHTKPAQSLAYTGFVPAEARQAQAAVEAGLGPVGLSDDSPDGCPEAPESQS